MDSIHAQRVRESEIPVAVGNRLPWVRDAVIAANCEACPLAFDGAKPSRRVPGIGPETAEIVFVGEALGALEANQGLPLLGPAGQLLDKCLEAAGIDREAECFVTNVCICRPPKNRTPFKEEIDACAPRLEFELDRVRPKIIVTLGSTALHAIMGSVGTLSDMRGRRLWSERYQCVVMPTYHPAAILRQASLFNDFMSDISRIRRYMAMPAGPLFDKPPQRVVAENLDHIRELRQEVSRQSIVACDIETDDLEYGAALLEIGLLWDPGFAVIIPGSLLDDPRVVHELQEMFNDTGPTFVWHNGKFDTVRLRWLYGLEAPVDEDTLLLHYCLDERPGTHGLKQLARDFFDAPDWEADIKKYLPKKDSPYSMIPPDVRRNYLAYDVYYTYRLYHELIKQVREEGMEGPYRNLLLPANKAFTDIEVHGVQVDLEYLKQLDAEIRPELETMRNELHDIAISLGLDPGRIPKGRFNPNSSMQVQVVIYDLLDCPPYEGSRTTKEEALLAYKDVHPFCQKLLDYRSLAKLHSTYVTGLMKHIGPDGRVHTDILLFGTVTGRLASRDPNLMNIPAHGAGKRIKRAFVATPGYTFVVADYRQLEFRVAAHYSQDPTLLQAFRDRVDIHRAVAASVYHKPPEEITDEERHRAKFVGFGILYGRGPASLARNELQCSVYEAEAFIEQFYAGMPQLRAWTRKMEQQAVTEGYLVTPFGRKRRFPFISPETVAQIKRQAVNAPIQSMASDICLHSLIELHTLLRSMGWGWCLFTVHDSVVMEIKTEYLEQALPLIHQVMENPPIDSNVPWEIEVEAGPNWLEVETIEWLLSP